MGVVRTVGLGEVVSETVPSAQAGIEPKVSIAVSVTVTKVLPAYGISIPLTQ